MSAVAVSFAFGFVSAVAFGAFLARIGQLHTLSLRAVALAGLIVVPAPMGVAVLIDANPAVPGVQHGTWLLVVVTMVLLSRRRLRGLTAVTVRS